MRAGIIREIIIPIFPRKSIRIKERIAPQKKLIQYYIDLIVSWYRKIKTYFNLNYEIKKYHDSFDKPKKPVIKEVGKFGDKDWSISIGNIDE